MGGLPQPSCRPPPSFLEEGQNPAPCPLYKESPPRRRTHTIPTRKKVRDPKLEPCPSPPAPLSLFLVRAPQLVPRLRRRELRKLHAVVLLDLRVWQFYFHKSAGSGKRKKSSSTVCVRNLRGVTLEALVVAPPTSTSSPPLSSSFLSAETLRSQVDLLH